MKIGIIRGSNLNKFEMQTYESLSKEFDITAFCLRGNNFNLKDISLPIEQLWGLDSFVPKRLRRYYGFAFNFILEINQPMFGLARKLKGFDIVHSADPCYYYTYQAAKHKRKHGYKLVLTVAENIPFLFGRNRFSKKRIQKILQEVDKFLPLTQRASETLTLQGIKPDRIRVIPFGVDTTLFRPLSHVPESYLRKFHMSKDDLVILFAGRFSRSKGVSELVYAARKILDDKDLRGKNVKYLLVGRGPKRKNIETLIRRLDLVEDFRIVCDADYSEMPTIHNIAEIFVLPSIVTSRWQEQFGMVLIESMACGKPVVSTLSGSIPEVVGDSGILVQSADHLSLYQALRKLILNENLRKELGRSARDRVEKNFSIGVVSQRLKEVYESL
jgi:glycosyltransferase involved in cell wall biosynthesis